MGSVAALCPVASTPVSTPLLSGRKKELEVSGFIFFPFFFFLPKVYFQCLSCGSHPQSSVYSYSALMD